MNRRKEVRQIDVPADHDDLRSGRMIDELAHHLKIADWRQLGFE